MWGELSTGELSLERDVCHSLQHGLYVNSLLGIGHRHVNHGSIDHPYKCHENTNRSRVL